MNNDYWIIDEAKTQGHWLEVNSPDGIDYNASVKWDGCVHFRRYFNGVRDDNSDYIHFCDLDDEIKRLTALRDMAIEKFGSYWGD
jgi:hypothetical protein